MPDRAAESATAPGETNGKSTIAPAVQGARRQRTIARSIVFGGQGLHSGLRTGVILHPAPVGFGIVFASLSDETQIPVQLENVTDTGYNTTLASGARSVRTVEHLMSALHGFGITNLLIKTDDEIPALDGSASEFCRQIAEAGVRDQDATVQPIRITTPITVRSKGDEFMTIEPADHLIIDYTLDYPAPIGVQKVHFELTSTDAYVKEVAPARTFGFVRDFAQMNQMGLAMGGRLDNAIIVDDQKIVNTKLRFPEEFARHKVLDLIGDLYLLGRPLEGHITASKTGHSDNLAMVKAIRASLAN